MNFQYTEECEDPVHIIELNITQKKYNRTTHVLDFTLNTPYGYGDFITVKKYYITDVNILVPLYGEPHHIQSIKVLFLMPYVIYIAFKFSL